MYLANISLVRTLTFTTCGTHSPANVLGHFDNHAELQLKHRVCPLYGPAEIFSRLPRLPYNYHLSASCPSVKSSPLCRLSKLVGRVALCPRRRYQRHASALRPAPVVWPDDRRTRWESHSQMLRAPQSLSHKGQAAMADPAQPHVPKSLIRNSHRGRATPRYPGGRRRRITSVQPDEADSTEHQHTD
jgi:hypothetical protein